MPGADTAVMAQDMRDGKHVGLHVQQEGSAGMSFQFKITPIDTMDFHQYSFLLLMCLLLSCSYHDIHNQCHECHEDADHLGDILLRLNPNLLEKVQATEHFHRYPEHDNRCDSHTDVGSPCAQTQLLSEDEETTYQASRCHDGGDRMMVAEEVLVVAEHQQEIACPQNHVQFHESNDTCMMCHRTGGNLILAGTEKNTLPPVDEVTSVFG